MAYMHPWHLPPATRRGLRRLAPGVNDRAAFGV